jgi:NADH-quinone oxidoreductase subunit G/NADP-reducing hydrogenase subunit HndD
MKILSLKINGKQVNAKEGQTILEIAQENGIEIPSLCHHPDLSNKADCRLCLVTINNCPTPAMACSTKAQKGMEIVTDSPELERLRKINLELIFSQHKEECNDCVWQPNCYMLELARKYRVEINRFPDRKTNFPCHAFQAAEGKPILEFDSSKCIDCRNCVEVCQKQQINHLQIVKRNNLQEIAPNQQNPCVFCGQCIMHCPAGAFESVGEFEDIEKPLTQKGKIVVFQFAPAVRTSIGEEFGVASGADLTGQITAGLKQLGANFVFDVSCGADFTTIEEAKESLERLQKNETLPMFSSCCPAWVRYIEVYHPHLIPHFTTVRSPHIILGGILKTYWAPKKKIAPQDLFVVSIMPCVAKKYEISREELKLNSLLPVDYVLTTRELARLFKKHKIDLAKIEPEPLDNPFGSYSGAGVIYGASGGVMESALRTAYAKITGGQTQIEFKPIRGQAGLKTATISLGKQKVKVAAANGLDNALKIINGLDKEFKDYACIEVMACWGGCIGGGGQPLPTNAKIRKARAEGLYQIDSKLPIRLAHENPAVKKFYQDYLKNSELIHQICHTTYFKKR